MMQDASKQKLASMPTFLFPAAVGGAG